MKIRLPLILLGLSLLPLPALAHSGSGNPYVLINGVYAPGNPINGIDTTLAQDLAPANYQVGTPLNIAVDRNAFGSPDYQFRWTWSFGEPTQEGDHLTHTFNKVGTQIVTLELKSAADQPFQLIDTVAINIAPKADYKTLPPKVKVTQLDNSGDGFKVKFEAAATADPSASITNYNWKFGDGSTGTGKVITHSFQGNDFRLFPLLEVTDSNNIKTDVSFELDGSEAKITTADIQAMPGVLSSAAQIKATSRHWQLWLGEALLAAGACVIIWALYKRRRRKTKKPR